MLKVIIMDSDIESNASDAEEVTAAEILQSMEEIWLNEKFAPDILPHKLEIVECVYLQVNTMEENISRLNKKDIRRCAHELELIRIKYFTSSYLRIRLIKIECYFQDILDKEEIRIRSGFDAYLTESERIYARSYKELLDEYLQSILNFIPNYICRVTTENPVLPNINSFVFFQSKKAVDGVIIGDSNARDDVVHIRDKSKMIMSYSNVAPLLENGNIKLI